MRIHYFHENDPIVEETTLFIEAWNDSKDFIIQQTSGSTGIPKEIRISKDKMRASARMTGSFFNLNNLNSTLLCISPEYIGGKMMIIRSLEYDLDLYVTSVYSQPLKKLDRKIDFAAMVPLQVMETLKHDPTQLNLIDNLIIGGAPVSEQLENDLLSIDCNCYSTYGMTETVSHVALKKLNGKNSPFYAIGSTNFDRSDKNQLVINAPDLGIAKLVTNDIVTIVDPKSFYWIGRSDFTINSGGIKIQPEEIEKKLSSFLPNGKFIIAGETDDRLGQRVILIGERSLEPIIDKDQLSLILDRYEIPKAFFYVTELAKTRSGKIDRLETLRMINGSK